VGRRSREGSQKLTEREKKPRVAEATENRREGGMEEPSPENTQDIPPNEGEGIAGADGGGESPLPEPVVPKSPVEAVCRKSLESLPISSHREKIMTSIRQNRMTCIQGETGCGKSSMVPLFIVEEAVSFF
jgi:hypothetical protein